MLWRLGSTPVSWHHTHSLTPTTNSSIVLIKNFPSRLDLLPSLCSVFVLFCFILFIYLFFFSFYYSSSPPPSSLFFNSSSFVIVSGITLIAIRERYEESPAYKKWRPSQYINRVWFKPSPQSVWLSSILFSSFCLFVSRANPTLLPITYSISTHFHTLSFSLSLSLFLHYSLIWLMTTTTTTTITTTISPHTITFYFFSYFSLRSITRFSFADTLRRDLPPLLFFSLLNLHFYLTPPLPPLPVLHSSPHPTISHWRYALVSFLSRLGVNFSLWLSNNPQPSSSASLFSVHPSFSF